MDFHNILSPNLVSSSFIIKNPKISKFCPNTPTSFQKSQNDLARGSDPLQKIGVVLWLEYGNQDFHDFFSMFFAGFWDKRQISERARLGVTLSSVPFVSTLNAQWGWPEVSSKSRFSQREFSSSRSQSVGTKF